MIIERRYQIETCVAQDDGRPVLTYVNIGTFRGQAVAVAADGFHLAVVPVELKERDVPGLVAAGIFRQAREWAPKTEYRLSFDLGAVRIDFANGWSAPRVGTGIGTFPDVEKVIESALEVQERATEFAINPRLLNSLEAAVGVSGHGGAGLVLHWTTESGPILAWPLDGDPDPERLRPPFGVVMPMYIASIESRAQRKSKVPAA